MDKTNTAQNMIAEIDELQSQLDDAKSNISQKVTDIIQMIKCAYSENDAKYIAAQKYYSIGTPSSKFLGNHLIPQYFDDFKMYDGMFSAGGMYQGARGYYESESIRFPAAFFDMTAEEIEDYIKAYEAALVVEKTNEIAKEKKSKEEKEKQRLKELLQKYPDVVGGSDVN